MTRTPLYSAIVVVGISSLTTGLAQQTGQAPKPAAVSRRVNEVAPKPAATTEKAGYATAKAATDKAFPYATRAIPWKGQPRTADGQPDFSGYWSNSTVTPLERPANLSEEETVTAEQAAALEKNGNRSDSPRGVNGRGGGGPGGVGHYNALWYEQGKKVLANNRTSIVTDPVSGHIPALTADAAAKQAAQTASISGRIKRTARKIRIQSRAASRGSRAVRRCCLPSITTTISLCRVRTRSLLLPR